jgi:GAF domain-containing protein
VVSQLALRLYNNDVTLGALNLYSDGEGPFDAASREMADLFAAAAATALGLSRAVTTLNEAVATRTSIGTAIGIVMERYDLDQEAAFAFMVRVSQTGNIKLRLVAEQIVGEASLKARSKG